MNNASTSQVASPNLNEDRPPAAKGQFWPRELLLGLMPLLIAVEIFAWAFYLPMGLRGFADFRSLYTSGYMTRIHDTRNLYDHDIVQGYMQKLVPMDKTFNIAMDHPAFEEVVYAPLSILPYRTALILFIILNWGVVALCVRQLGPSFKGLSDRWKPLPALLFVAFFPITKAIVQGQDSALLLGLLVGAYVCTEKKEDFLAGLLTGLGLFKFQVVIPIAVIFLLWRRWRFVVGFGISSGIAAAISLLWVGMHGTRQYATMLLVMSLRPRSEAAALRGAFSPKTMLNLRGLLSAMFTAHLGHWWLQGLIAAASLAVLWFAARCRPSLPLAIVAAALVSYHLNAQDACVLIIPLGLCLGGESVWAAVAALATLIVPMSAIAPLFGYLGALPILALLFATASDNFLQNQPLRVLSA